MLIWYISRLYHIADQDSYSRTITYRNLYENTGPASIYLRLQAFARVCAMAGC